MCSRNSLQNGESSGEQNRPYPCSQGSDGQVMSQNGS